MKASGLPSDIDFDKDDATKKRVAGAADLVFEHSVELPNTYQISEALDELSLSKFNLKAVTSSTLDIIQMAIQEILEELLPSCDGENADAESVLVRRWHGCNRKSFKELVTA